MVQSLYESPLSTGLDPTQRPDQSLHVLTTTSATDQTPLGKELTILNDKIHIDEDEFARVSSLPAPDAFYNGFRAFVAVQGMEALLIEAALGNGITLTWSGLPSVNRSVPSFSFSLAPEQDLVWGNPDVMDVTEIPSQIEIEEWMEEYQYIYTDKVRTLQKARTSDNHYWLERDIGGRPILILLNRTRQFCRLKAMGETTFSCGPVRTLLRQVTQQTAFVLDPTECYGTANLAGSLVWSDESVSGSSHYDGGKVFWDDVQDLTELPAWQTKTLQRNEQNLNFSGVDYFTPIFMSGNIGYAPLVQSFFQLDDVSARAITDPSLILEQPEYSVMNGNVFAQTNEGKFYVFASNKNGSYFVLRYGQESNRWFLYVDRLDTSGAITSTYIVNPQPMTLEPVEELAVTPLGKLFTADDSTVFYENKFVHDGQEYKNQSYYASIQKPTQHPFRNMLWK